LITDGFFGNARVIETRIAQLIECLDRPAIPLVTGFQGISPTGHAITTLGEGGSDYTAVCLAYALMHTERAPLQEPIELQGVEVYKDVDGIMTANPANFPDGQSPRRIPRLTFDELCAMSQYGADVIQAEAARMARRYNITVTVRNFRAPDDPGTIIDADSPSRPTRLVTGMADMPGMIVFRVADGNERTHRRVGELLSQARLNFHALPVGESWKFAVKREKYREVDEVAETMLRPRGLNPVFEEGQWALVTLVGEGLHGKVDETAARAAETLAAAGIRIEGEIRNTLSYSALLPEEQRKEAILALHDEFIASGETEAVG